MKTSYHVKMPLHGLHFESNVRVILALISNATFFYVLNIQNKVTIVNCQEFSHFDNCPQDCSVQGLFVSDSCNSQVLSHAVVPRPPVSHTRCRAQPKTETRL